MNIRFDPPVRTMADLLHRLGDISPARVRLNPVPGTATVADLLNPENEGCELIDGTLVEKAVGWEESFLAIWLATLLNQFVIPRNLGAVTGEAGLMELPGGPVRGPDVAFTSWDRMANRARPSDPVPELAPDLAVEVLSASNTPGEMARKRDEYFRAGVRLVWEIDPRARTVRAYTAAGRFTDLTANDTLTGDPVLPGFTLPLAHLFAELDRHG
jgi:Uma2 family endonuclease